MRVVKKDNGSRYLYIKISDMLGIAKTTKESLKVLAKTKKIDGIKPPAVETRDSLTNYAVQYNLSMVKTMVIPLIALMTADQIFQALITVYEISKPMLQAGARGTGVWVSPGNIGDIACLALGVAQKVLIQLAVFAYVTIKNLILNFEVEVPLSSPEAANIITQAINDVYNRSVALDHTQAYNDDIFALEEDYIIIDEPEIIDYKNYEFAFVLKTNYNNITIAGSSVDEGLFWSDDNQKTWNRTNIVKGSFLGDKSICGFSSEDSIFYCVGGCKNNISLESIGLLYTEDGKEWYYGSYNGAQSKNIDVTEIRFSNDEGKQSNYNVFTLDVGADNNANIYYSSNGKNWSLSSVELEANNVKYIKSEQISEE